jgi:hypothetical protein
MCGGLSPSNYLPESNSTGVSVIIDRPDGSSSVLLKLDLESFSNYNELFDMIQTELNKPQYNVYLYRLAIPNRFGLLDDYKEYDFNKESLRGKKISIYTARKFDTPDDFMNSLFGRLGENGIRETDATNIDISHISAEKPLATFNSKSFHTGIGRVDNKISFLMNWINLESERKAIILASATKYLNDIHPGKIPIDFDIHVNPSRYMLFYSKPHFNILCNIFGYTMDDSVFKLLDVIIPNTSLSNEDKNKKYAFIYIAFGDLIVKETLELDMDSKSAKRFMKKNPEFIPLFKEYKK